MDQTCGNCKFWSETKEWMAKASGTKCCERIRHMKVVEDLVPKELQEYAWDWDDETAGGAAYRAASDKVFGEAKAVVKDGSDYMAELLTRPDFGCVLFETKE